MALTDLKISKAIPEDKPYRLADGDNLYLFVATTGVKSWQYRYRLNGKPLTASLGKYPRITLKDARSKAEAARDSAAAGEHLTQKKKMAKLAKIATDSATFGVVKRDWLIDERKRQKWSADYLAEVTASLNRHLSDLHSLPIRKINAPLVAPILKAIERKTPAMLEKIHRRLHSIMDYAIEQGLIEGNPLPRRRARVERNHYPAVTDLSEVGEILKAARAADPAKGIMRAHVLLAFTGMRVSEVAGALWPEFHLDGVDIVTDHKKHHDADAGNWVIPRNRMKRKDEKRGPHVVPLPPDLIRQLKQWRTADAGGTTFVCCAPRDPVKHVTPEGIEKFYRRTLSLAGKHSPHSWRSTFSTICRDAGKSGEVIEAQLDHVVGTKIESAYDRAARLELRRELMRWYEGKLIAARDGAQVIPLHSNAP